MCNLHEQCLCVEESNIFMKSLRAQEGRGIEWSEEFKDDCYSDCIFVDLVMISPLMTTRLW